MNDPNEAKVKSLGWYIAQKRETSPELEMQDFLLHQLDYPEFLREIEDIAKQEAGADTHALLPLDAINLSAREYLNVVLQIFNNIPPNQLPWVPSQPQSPAKTRYYEKYVNALEEKGDMRTRADVESIMGRMNKILAQRPENEKRVNGLVVGRVQSGKTRNYVGLILKAVAEGWNVVIVLTSPSKSLLAQTKERLETDFTNAVVDSGFQLTFAHAANEENHAPPANCLPNNFYWTVAMKQTHALQGILAWLRWPANEQYIQNMKILVVDDEADNATPDGNAGKDKQLTPAQMEELIAAVREEKPADLGCLALANWMDNLQDEIEGKTDQALDELPEDIKADIEDAVEGGDWKTIKAKIRRGIVPDAIRPLLDIAITLASTGPDTRKMADILNDQKLRDILGLVEIQGDNGPIDLKGQVERYFSKRQARGEDPDPHAKSTFIKFLNTVFSVAISRSAINRSICELIDRVPGTNASDYAFPFKQCAYVAYTATPYANILNERPNETPLYADFIKSLSTPVQYFGLEKIFGVDWETEQPNMNIVQSIGADDKRFVLNHIQRIKDTEHKYVLPVKIDGKTLGYTCKYPASEGSWKSLQEALAWAFCTAGARRQFYREIFKPSIENNSTLTPQEKEKKLQEVDNRWTTMLMNISQKQETHELVQEYVAGYLQERCENCDARNEFLKECKATWDEFTQSYTKEDFDRGFNNGNGENYGPILDYPTWESIEKDVRYFLDGWNDTHVHPIVINSAHAENRGRYSDGSVEDCHLWIVIGGNIIGRGLTLAGLTASYFDRVRKTVAVDTLTQMGRWFGYRKDYELLPRIWMTKETVKEMKRTAFVEKEMHESMRTNFEAEYSPCDSLHYEKIYSWGRQLSGRARAAVQLDSRIGTIASADEYFGDAEKRKQVFTLCSDFVSRLGQQSERNPDEYTYAKTPLWENVGCLKIRAFLESLLPCQPPRSSLLLQGLMREIDTNEIQNWDVVLGHPEEFLCEVPFGGFKVRCGSPSAQEKETDSRILRTPSARLHLSFYAMIRSRWINLEDVAQIRAGKDKITEILQGKPDKLSVLQGYPGTSIPERLDALLKRIEDLNGTESVPPEIHGCLREISEGIRNRSAAKYMANVHARANHTNPVLQMYLIRPRGEGPETTPLVNFSFYWPKHENDGFYLLSIGMEEPPKPEQRIRAAVERILQANQFPMGVHPLRRKVKELFPEYDAQCCELNIPPPNPPLAGIHYARYPGKDAYYHLDLPNPQEMVAQFILDKAVEILQDGKPHKRKDLAARILNNNYEKLGGLFNDVSGSDVNDVFSPERLQQRGIIAERQGQGGTYIFQLKA